MVTDIVYFASQINEKDKQIHRIISSSRDNLVYIHDEDFVASNSLRHEIKSHYSNVNCLSIQDDFLVSGADNGSIILTNLSSNRQDFMYTHEHEVKKLLFLTPYACIVACDARGGILFLSSQ